MRGGIKPWRGSGAEARSYVEKDHSLHADAYYLREGRGLAEHMVFDGGGTIVGRSELDGPNYEAWVNGFDPVTGEAKGRLRNDEHANRFLEVIVNGPKEWSIAAALHPEISEAYDAAQDRAVEAIGKWVAQNATTRVGGRNLPGHPAGCGCCGQKQAPVEQMSMAAVRHYTSRAGDPHRHIHLQINSRVFAQGKWRSIDSAAVFRMSRALNGIGNRAVAADPGFRVALARHGYALDEEGQIRQLAGAVPAMSKRSKQVEIALSKIEREWREEHPGEEPGRELRRLWDHRAWNEGRPKKKLQTPGTRPESGWETELRRLGVDVDGLRAQQPVDVTGVLPGQVDRDEMAGLALQVLSAGHRGRSTWNAYDIRGAVEELLAEQGLFGEDKVAAELAEDIAERVRTSSMTVLDDRPVVPAHVRHLTSTHVVELERDLQTRLMNRSLTAHVPAAEHVVAAAARSEGRVLSPAQAEAVQAMAGTGDLVLLEGPAGTGKTTVLSTVRDVLEDQGRRMVVVAPSKNAAMVAGEELQTDTNTAAALVFGHGFRWDKRGLWTRLSPGETCPVTGKEYRGPSRFHRLGEGDLLVVDEADMLNQETAQALLTIADEEGARVALVGDQRQISAVGRGGVIGMAAEWAPAHVELDTVHRFRLADGSVDSEYAKLSLRVRSGKQPGAVFDRLAADDHIQVVPDTDAAVNRIALSATQRVLAGQSQAVVAATNDLASAINERVRQHLVEAGRVDDSGPEVHGSDGLRIGRGDRVMTRENDAQRGVANRATWGVTAVRQDGSITVRAERDGRHVTLSPEYVREQVHSAYAVTAHAVQGRTAEHGTALLTDEMDHAAVYVSLTRGRYSNTLVVVAKDLDEAREQFVAAADRDRADLGLESETRAALDDANRYSREGVVRPHAQVPDSELAQRIVAAQQRVEDVQAELDRIGEAAGGSAVRLRLMQEQRDQVLADGAEVEVELRSLRAEESLRIEQPGLSVPDEGTAPVWEPPVETMAPAPAAPAGRDLGL